VIGTSPVASQVEQDSTDEPESETITSEPVDYNAPTAIMTDRLPKDVLDTPPESAAKDEPVGFSTTSNKDAPSMVGRPLSEIVKSRPVDEPDEPGDSGNQWEWQNNKDESADQAYTPVTERPKGPSLEGDMKKSKIIKMIIIAVILLLVLTAIVLVAVLGYLLIGGGSATP
jgi:hypothetical protein